MDSLVNVNMDISPSEKLAEVISSALGAWIAPWVMKRMAKAKAEGDRITAIEGAKTEALLINDYERYVELSTVEKRILSIEQKRQKNIDNVIEVAMHTLDSEKQISSDPVNPDWATRFFDIAQDISDEQMQDLWGRILAGEVKQPHSYSLRTLEALKNISKEEAQLFEKISQYVLYDQVYYIYHESADKNDGKEVKYPEIARLVEMGFVQPGSMVTQNYYNHNNEQPMHHLFYDNRYIAFIEMPNGLEQMSFPIYPLTKVGEELYRLISPEPNIGYFENVLHSILKENKHISKDIKISYAKLNWVDFTIGQFNYDDDTICEIQL